MPLTPQVDHSRYFNKGYGSLERFISYYYQIDLVNQCESKEGEPLSLLEVGIGDSLVSTYLEKLGYAVTKCDIDEELKPDVVADVRKLPIAESSFDIVMACQILEHIPFEDLGPALEELNRVSKRYCLISLPFRSTGFEIVMKFPYIRTIFNKDLLDLFFRIPLRFGGFETSLQHYWEIDKSKYSLNKVRAVLKSHFNIVKESRPVMDSYHYYFLLEKK